MKNKASLLLLSLLLIVPSCNKNTDSSTSSETSEETKFEGTYVINDFENMDDLYRVKQLLHQISYRVDCELSIDNENVQNGNGSLHVTYNNNTYGQIYQRNALSPINEIPSPTIKLLTNFVSLRAFFSEHPRLIIHITNNQIY